MWMLAYVRVWVWMLVATCWCSRPRCFGAAPRHPRTPSPPSPPTHTRLVHPLQYVVPKPKAECSKTEQIGVSFAAGYIAGVFCAIVSHPADNLVSKLNATKVRVQSGGGGGGGEGGGVVLALGCTTALAVGPERAWLLTRTRHCERSNPHAHTHTRTHARTPPPLPTGRHRWADHRRDGVVQPVHPRPAPAHHHDRHADRPPMDDLRRGACLRGCLCV